MKYYILMKYILRCDDFLIINENLQKAEKELFKPGILNDTDKQHILSVTNKDNFTYVISMIYKYLLDSRNINRLDKYYDMIKTYNKNVFPISDLTDFNSYKNIGELVSCLDTREKCINIINSFPSIAKRNLKDEITETRGSYAFHETLHSLEYLSAYIALLTNKPEETKNKIYQKIFKSNSCISDMIDFVENKNNLIADNYFNKQAIDDILMDESEDDIAWCVEKIYDKNNRYALMITDVEGIIKLGANSLWCFTYGKSYRQFDEFSYNGIVYLLIDFNLDPSDSEYMCVVINPDFENEAAIFNQTNETLYDEDDEYNRQIPYLERFFGKKIDDISSILDFEN